MTGVIVSVFALSTLTTASVVRLVCVHKRSLRARQLTISVVCFAIACALLIVARYGPAWLNPYGVASLARNLIAAFGYVAIAKHALISLRRADKLANCNRHRVVVCLVLVGSWVAASLPRVLEANEIPFGIPSNPAMSLHWIAVAYVAMGAWLVLALAVFEGLDGAGERSRLVLLTWFAAAAVGIVANVKRVINVISPWETSWGGSWELSFTAGGLLACGVIMSAMLTRKRAAVVRAAV